LVEFRPQPSWDRTCTAAAAAGLLSDLQVLPQFSSYCLDKQAEAVEDALDALLEALTTRRVRMGRSITRKMRNCSNICWDLARLMDRSASRRCFIYQGYWGTTVYMSSNLCWVKGW